MLCTASVCAETKFPRYLLIQICEGTGLGEVTHWTAYSAHSLRPISTQPQPAQPVHNTICSNTRTCSPDDGHNDARNMLR